MHSRRRSYRNCASRSHTPGPSNAPSVRRAFACEILEPRTLLSGSISGQVWNDLNANGLLDSGEPGLAGRVVYLDQNRNRVRDAGEASATTDANGLYTFANLAAGQYFVGEEVPVAWEQTYPGPGGSPGSPSAAPQGTVSPQVNYTYTGSDAPAVVDGEPAPSDVVAPSDVEADGLIHLGSFRSDPRFAGIDGHGYSVVIIDTGIDLNHPFFGPDADNNGIADRIVYQHDFADNDNDASDVNGHGSNVASIAAGQDATYNGVATGANIIALKVFTNAGSGTFGYIEQALQWVVANADAYNIAAVNMSLGDSQNWATSQQLYGISDELAALAAKNVIVSSADGNDYFKYQTQGVSYPAADPNSLAVGAVYDANVGKITYADGAIDNTTAGDRIASFSQRSTALTDVFAPGAIITGANANGGTASYTGTSQASPYVAGLGVIAQQLAMQQLGRRLTPAEFRDVLRSSGVTITDGDDENDNVANTGATFPRIDALALANAIYNMGSVLPYGHTLTLATDQNVGGINFGTHRLNIVPTTPDLVAAYDTGYKADDDLTKLNNSGTSNRMQFTLGNVWNTATVSLYSDGVLIGSAVAAATGSLTVTTDGTTVIPDGAHHITARQQLPGDAPSADSTALSVVVDSVAPAMPAPVDLQAGSDSGISATDDLTNITRPTFDVQAAEPGFINMRVDGSLASGRTQRADTAGVYGVPSGGTPVTFPQQVTYPIGNGPYRVRTADVNADGKLDLIAPDINGHTIGILVGNGDGTFQPVRNVGVSFGPMDAVSADFNLDGLPDLIAARGSYIALFLAGAGLTFAPEVDLPVTAVANLAAGDLNGDGKPDIAATEQQSNMLRVFFGNGDGTFQPSITLPAFVVPTEVTIVDVNKDGKPDVVILSGYLGQVSVYLGNGDGTFRPPVASACGNNRQRLQIRDFDNDGKLDLATVDYGAGKVAFCRGNGDGTFQPPLFSASVGNQPQFFCSGDFNADGRMDLAALTKASNFITYAQVCFGNGDGTFAAPQPYEFSSATDITAGDFNGDGKDDLAAPDLGVNNVYLRLAKGGSFADGVHAAASYLEDWAGNQSPVSAPLSFTVDTAAPAAPGAPDLDSASDTGGDGADDLTAATSLTFNLTGASPYFRFRRSGAPASGAYEAGGAFTLPSESPGTYSYAASAVDAAGNESPQSSPLLVTILSATPGAAFQLTGSPGSRTLSVSGGAVTLANNLSAAYPGLSLAVSGGASAVFNSAEQFASLDLSGGSLSTAAGGALTVGALSIDADSSLDTKGSDLIVDNSLTPAPMVRSYLTTGYAGGAWTGPGIRSSLAAADPSHFSLGYADGSVTTAGGVPADEILVRYTRRGDANLDYRVDIQDLLILRANSGTTGGAQWWQADFNYDGKVDIQDLLAFRANAGSTPPVQDPTYVSDLTPLSAQNGWGPVEKDQSVGGPNAGDGQPLRIGGQQFAKGLGTNAYSQVIYDLGGRYGRFLAQVGVDDEVGDSAGTVVFQIWSDGVKLYDSGVLTGADGPRPVSVDVTGLQHLELAVLATDDGASNDHADWADAKLFPPAGPIQSVSTFTAAAASLTAIGGTLTVGSLVIDPASSPDLKSDPLLADRTLTRASSITTI